MISKSMEQPPAERICEARRKFARNICLLSEEEMAQLHNLQRRTLRIDNGVYNGMALVGVAAAA